MAKKEEKDEVVEKTDRELRWEARLAKYKAQSPEKYAIKLAQGRYAKIPDDFI